MQVIVLGSGTCALTARRACASYAVRIAGDLVLLDAGSGALRRMSEAALDYRDIDAVVCSHTHPDHVADLAPLLMALRYTPGYRRSKPLTLVGPAGFRDFHRALAGAYGEKTLAADGYPMSIVELENRTMTIGEWSLTGRSMEHSRCCNGYRFEHRGRVLAYSGDTGPCDAVVEIGRAADLMLMECSFPDESPVEGHLTPSWAGRLAARAGCVKLVLTHLYPHMDDIDMRAQCRVHFSGDVEVAEDLAQFRLEDK